MLKNQMFSIDISAAHEFNILSAICGVMFLESAPHSPLIVAWRDFLSCSPNFCMASICRFQLSHYSIHPQRLGSLRLGSKSARSEKPRNKQLTFFSGQRPKKVSFSTHPRLKNGKSPKSILLLLMYPSIPFAGSSVFSMANSLSTSHWLCPDPRLIF